MLNIELLETFGRLIKQQNWHVADNRPAAAHAIRVTFMALDETHRIDRTLVKKREIHNNGSG